MKRNKKNSRPECPSASGELGVRNQPIEDAVVSAQPCFLRRERAWIFFLESILVLCGIAVYANSLDGVFVMDDLKQIVHNENIRSLALPWAFIENVRRPFLYLTFTFNYAIGGVDPRGYHLFNLAVHLLSGLLLFRIISRSIEFLSLSAKVKKEAGWLSFFVALIWLVHPLHTSAVTYIVQRAESLTGMLCLSVFYFTLRYFADPAKRWVVLTGVAYLLAGFTKETAATLPLVILLFDRAFVAGTFKEAFCRHARVYLALLVTWLVMGWLLLSTSPEKVATAGFSIKEMTPVSYALNQPAVILNYLQKFFWPANFVFDYGWVVERSWQNFWLPVVTILSFFGLSIGWYFRKPVVGFPLVVFFILLLPSSSFIPLKDLAFDYRMYLPSIPVDILTVGLIWFLLQKFLSPAKAKIATVALLTATASALGTVTVQQNQNYSSEERLWQAVIAKRPENSRACNNLATVLIDQGRLTEAGELLQRAVTLRLDFAAAYVNLGEVYSRQGNPVLAKEHFLKALKFDPTNAPANSKLGLIYATEKKLDEAVHYFRAAIAADPKQALYFHNLGAALLEQGKCVEALPNFEQELALGSRESTAYFCMAFCLKKVGRLQDSEEYMKKFLSSRQARPGR